VRRYIFALFLFFPLISFAQEIGPSIGDLQEIIDSPLVLYLLMLAGSGVSGLKQLTVGKMSGSKLTFVQYLGYWPELLATLGSNTLAFITLIQLDQLNFMAAIGIGYALNSLSDLLPAGSRSDGVANHK
jgi:hypothetical protein